MTCAWQMVSEASGLMKKTVKGLRYLLLMRRENVDQDKLPRLDEALKHNEPLLTAYLLKEALILLWEQSSYARMRSFFRQWCDWALDSGIRQMMQMAKSLLLHSITLLSIRSEKKHEMPINIDENRDWATGFCSFNTFHSSLAVCAT